MKINYTVEMKEQDELWKDEKEALKAKEVFYRWKDYLPVTTLQSEAEEMLRNLSVKNEMFFIVTTEYKHLMFREVASCRGAAHARGFAGSVPCKELLSISAAIADIYKQIILFGEQVVLVASKKDESIASRYGWEFIEATPENFVQLSK